LGGRVVGVQGVSVDVAGVLDQASGGGSGTCGVLAGQQASAEWAIRDYAQPLGVCEGQDLDFGLSTNQVVHRLDQLEAGQGFPGLDPEGGRDLPGRPV